MATTTEDEKKEALRNVKDTLSTGMNSIRNSIHNIYEESIDLEAKITALLNDFSFCKATLAYQIEQELPLKTNYSILYIIKEALTNVMKHSDATLVSISFIEHPIFYQLVIKDNGISSSHPDSNLRGIGLNSITERVANSNGYLHLVNESGFCIFITLPKGEQQT